MGLFSSDFGHCDPCQASRIIGSMFGGGLVGTGDRSQGMARNNGAPKILPENFGVHVEGGGVWSCEGLRGGRGVPNLNSFYRPWGKLRER